MHEHAALLGLRRLQAPDIVRRVQEALEKRLQDGAPRRAQIASDLHVSDRTLQRRLAHEKTSFEALIQRTRQSVAEQLLANEKASFVDIAFMLGYTDERSFFRACSRWFGRTPGEIRGHGGTSNA
jgi:AraC-like DNA-binding protein